jgi:hypothetical protein
MIDPFKNNFLYLLEDENDKGRPNFILPLPDDKD